MLPYATITELNLGIITIQVWGLAVAIGVMIAAMFAAKRAKHEHLNIDAVYDIIFYGLLAGLIGARILYVIEEWQHYSINPIEIAMFWKGGLSFTGGIIAAAIAAYLYIRKHRLNFSEYADLLAPSIVLAHIFGRVGCYIIGDHLGAPTTLPWAIMQEGILRHPIILYEIIYLAIIFIILLKIHKMRTIHGTIFTAYLLMYSFARFFNDFFRIEQLYAGLTVAQYLMIVIFISALVWNRFNYKK